MHERQISEILTSLGLGRLEFRLLQILPLVQVAWADGGIVHADREALTTEAAAMGLGAGAGPAIERWADERPSHVDFYQGLRVLVHLTHRYDGVDDSMDVARLQVVLDACDRMVRVSGGFLGLALPSRKRLDEVQGLRADIDGLAGDEPKRMGVDGWTTMQHEMVTHDQGMDCVSAPTAIPDDYTPRARREMTERFRALREHRDEHARLMPGSPALPGLDALVASAERQVVDSGGAWTERLEG